MKKYKAIDMLWALSLIIIGVSTIILSVTSVIGYSNRALTVTLGVVELISIFVLSFTTVRKFIENKSKNSR